MRSLVGSLTVWKAAALAGLFSVCFACRQTPEAPPPLVEPGLGVHVKYFAGTPLSGPQGMGIGPFGARDCVAVRATYAVVERMPPNVLPPISARARLIADTRDGLSILPTKAQTRAGRYGPVEDADAFLSEITGEPFGRSAVISTAEAALPKGATVAFRLSDTRPPGAPASPQGDFTVQVFRRARAAEAIGEVHIALAVHAAPDVDLASADPEATLPTESTTDLRKALPRPRTPSIETVIFDGIPSDRLQSHAIILPFSTKSADTRSLVAILETEPGTPDNLAADALDQARQGLEHSLPKALPEHTAPQAAMPVWPSLASALKSLSDQRLRRTALSFLARETGAQICEDAAMVADEVSLAKLADRVNEELRAARLETDDTHAKWILDRSALETLRELLADGDIQPELASVLTLHTGELGRRPASLGDALTSASTSQELTAQFAHWNSIFLEDTSPAARVRAYDWLRSLGQAPAGYDPLGPRSARRAALMKAREETETSPTSGEQK